MFFASRIRPAPEGVPDPPPPTPPSPVDLGTLWMFLGDSQTGGRATGTTKAHVEAFCRIWQDTAALAALGPATPYTGLDSNPYRNGVGGRRLGGDNPAGGTPPTRVHYDGRTERLTRTWVHLQESGDQSASAGVFSGQVTAEDFGDTFDAFVSAIIGNTPDAVISYETAFSFGREEEDNRDWTDWNTELRARVAAWADHPTTPKDIYIVETDANIKALQADIGAGNVWFQTGETNAYHFKNAGNLMVALSMYDALGYDVGDLVLTGIDQVSTEYKDACLAVITG